MKFREKENRINAMAKMFDMARVFFLLILIPLSLMVILVMTGIFKVGETARVHTSAALSEEYRHEFRLRAVTVANEIARFLEGRRDDTIVASLLPRTEQAYREFISSKRMHVPATTGDEAHPFETPLYKEMVYIDSTGKIRVCVSHDSLNVPSEHQRLNSDLWPESAYKKCLAAAMVLGRRKVYVSPLLGRQLTKEEFEKGRKFAGSILFATPLFESGIKTGALILNLDAGHLGAFTDPLTRSWTGSVPDPSDILGSSIYVVDYRGLIVSHPLEYVIAGLDENGMPTDALDGHMPSEQVTISVNEAQRSVQSYRDIYQIVRINTSSGKSGIITYRIGGKTKVVAYAPIYFFSTESPPPGGFGWVGIGMDVDALTARAYATSKYVEKEVTSWSKTIVIVLFASVIALLLISALLSGGISRQYRIIANDRARHMAMMESEFQEKERTLLQIVQGSTIPTFVINRDHMVTHWNIALERMTGFNAEDMIGTKKHWSAFYVGEKPIMADLIVDNAGEEEIRSYYGEKARKSPFIEGAFEAEGFFPHIGGGSWLYFTAAPIKGPDGSITGAIETLWDRTDSKLLHAEREKHLRRLSILWNITAAISATMDPDERIRAASKGIFDNFNIDSLAVYMKGKDDQFRATYSFGYRDEMFQKGSGTGPDNVLERVAQSGNVVFIEQVAEHSAPFPEFTGNEGLKSAAYVPLTSPRGVFGVARVSSHTSESFSEEDKNLLVIISNHIALEIENARLHHETMMFSHSLEEKVKEKTRKLEDTYYNLRISEEKYRTMFDADPTPIIIADRETLQIIDVNATAMECYGCTRDEFLLMNFTDLAGRIDQEVLEGLERISTNPRMSFTKKLHRRKNGSTFYVNIHISAVKFMERDCLIATTPDITQNVEQETQLIQASKMATLGTMASGIAHEISQPLNVMQVCADFLMKSVKKGERVKDDDLLMMSEQIEKNVQRAAQTIRHMKDFVRKSDSKQSGVMISINNPIQDVFKLLGQQLKVHGIDVVLDLAPELPMIVADHNRLEQVFINLVTNARDALDEKGLHMEDQEWKKTLAIRTSAGDGKVIVTVTDNGTGISDEIREKIFEPFFTTKDVGKGTGLGISISYGIVNDYHGTIDVTSKVGKWTTFRLTFPAVGNSDRL